ncbi:MAG: DUF1573 domain-containing protein [Bacteroidetes bacterium]|nr:DUF1573 domain-containing protein [Bacteroidota bacterium]
MRILNILFIITLLILLNCYSQPKLSVNATEIYLGKIYSGETIKGTLTLKNIGNDTLIIHDIRPSCGCTTVKQPKRFLLPKESDNVEIEFKSAGFRGQVAKFVNIVTNDPSSQTITIKLTIDVVEILTPHTPTPWFGEIALHDTASRTLTYTNTSGNALRITNIITSTSNVHVLWDKKTLQPNELFTINVTVRATNPGFRNEYIWIETDHSKQKRYEVRISYIGKQ